MRAARNAADGREALSALCRRYWFPIYASLRRQGMPPVDAEDQTQGFFLHLIERGVVSRADPDRGRFRNFMLGALRWYLANDQERRRALKRGGDNLLNIDIAEVESWLPSDPDQEVTIELEFDRQWAHSLVRNALTDLQAEYAGNGQMQLFAALRPCLDPSASASPSYELLAERLASTEGAIKVAAHRLRGRFREVLRSEVAATVTTAQEVDEELAHLRAVLSSAAASQSVS